MRKTVFSWNETIDQGFGANLKYTVFAKFCYKFLAFLHFFSFSAQKNVKNAYFSQR